MIGPTKKPDLKPGDHHLIVNDISETIKCYDSSGNLKWEAPCLARGQYGETEWRTPRSDTPPGLYKCGTVYDDYRKYGDNAPYDRTLMAYGWATIDLIDLEGNEDNSGRAGICIHGGGSACGWPGAWLPQQHLTPTFGCVRVYNRLIEEEIVPLTEVGTVYVSVYQEG